MIPREPGMPLSERTQWGPQGTVPALPTTGWRATCRIDNEDAPFMRGFSPPLTLQGLRTFEELCAEQAPYFASIAWLLDLITIDGADEREGDVLE